MLNHCKTFIPLTFVISSFLFLQACGPKQNGLEGHWRLVPEKSSSIDPWNSIVLDISRKQDSVTIRKTYSVGNAYDQRFDSKTINTKGVEQVVRIPPGRWLGQVSMGVYYGPSATRRATARWTKDGSELRVNSRETLETSQGESDTEIGQTFAASSDGVTLTIHEERSTRSTGPLMKYTFIREGK